MAGPFSSAEELIEEIRAGRLVVMVDDADRENEGDLICAAEKVTPEIINFMLRHGRGLLCLALTRQRCEQLMLPLQTQDNTAPYGTAFTVTIDAHGRFGVTTGVSAADRATTIRIAVDDATQPADLLRPGHIQPIMARDGGVLVRAGHTEAAVDLARLAGMVQMMDQGLSSGQVPEEQRALSEYLLKVVKARVAELEAAGKGPDQPKADNQESK